MTEQPRSFAHSRIPPTKRAQHHPLIVPPIHRAHPLSAPGHPRIAGFDEVGRGCLAGAVIAAAVILPDDGSSLPGLTDSKQLSPRRREEMAALIRKTAVAFGIGRAGPAEIDELNILQASLLAMQRAYDAPERSSGIGLVDGKHCPLLPCAPRAIVGGDLSVPAISAASILAKVYRDREMVIAEAYFRGYGFAIHKGYPTAAHRAALNRLGPSPCTGSPSSRYKPHCKPRLPIKRGRVINARPVHQYRKGTKKSNIRADGSKPGSSKALSWAQSR